MDDIDAASGDGAAFPPSLVRVVTILNRRGLHARAAAKFVSLVERFDASIDVARDDLIVSARSIMGLMLLGAGQGSTIEMRAGGREAREALEALAALVADGFNEHD